MSEATFKAAILANFRGLHSGNLTVLDFADAMYSSIRRGFEQAFAEGALSCGIKADERTGEEQARLDLMIGDNFQYVGSLADWLFQHSKANGVKFADVTYRADMWINRYQEVKAVAQSLSCSNLKYEWRLGNSEHCRTCLKLSGRVHRMKVWEAHVLPRQITDKLKCQGYNCKCTLTQTDAPITKGRFPNLP